MTEWAPTYSDEEPCVWGTGDPALWALRARDRGGVEFADRRGAGDFPTAWGEAPGTQFSEERAAWVRAHVEKRNRGTAAAALRLAQALELS